MRYYNINPYSISMDHIQQLILDLGKRKTVSLSINSLAKSILNWTYCQQYETHKEEIRVKRICKLAIDLVYSRCKDHKLAIQTVIEFGDKLSKADKITALQLAQVLVFETDLASETHLEAFLVEVSKTINLLIHTEDKKTSNFYDYIVLNFKDYLDAGVLDLDKNFEYSDLLLLLPYINKVDSQKKKQEIKSIETTPEKTKDKPKNSKKQPLTHEESLNRLTLLMESAERADYYVEKLKKCRNVPDIVRHVVRAMITDTQTKINYDTAVSREFWDMIQPLVSFTEGFSKRNPYRLVVKYCGDLNN